MHSSETIYNNIHNINNDYEQKKHILEKYCYSTRPSKNYFPFIYYIQDMHSYTHTTSECEKYLSSDTMMTQIFLMYNTLVCHNFIYPFIKLSLQTLFILKHIRRCTVIDTHQRQQTLFIIMTVSLFIHIKFCID